MEETINYHARMARGYKIIHKIMSTEGKQNVGRARQVVKLLEANTPKLLKNGHIQHLAAIKAALEMLSPPEDSKAILEPPDTIPAEERKELVNGIMAARENSRWKETNFTDKRQKLIKIVLEACKKGINHASEAIKPQVKA